MLDEGRRDDEGNVIIFHDEQGQNNVVGKKCEPISTAPGAILLLKFFDRS